ncbi:hypothetical protein BAE36_17405 [Rhizobium leguminosarum bv. trifolii]|uniref:TnsA endonuclease N-terminal domain-containing protein n=1 Tax=Rhizobium leguminosarum bv. trifolii TaxID=386 RepID=A0A1B8RAY1_RHILT|nr:hypothetical protein [Rhizobium leguminosarum]AOO91240.1 hypothetical protein [Rhizobium leguminosarum bv. trifolii]OBY05979.1 hypothetical protein BAE36_17405 [Rhizobium leguminosarum bv. trifolii]
MSIEQSSSPAWKPAPQGQIFYPSATVRCDGPAVFRNQFARDVACLLDIDDAIADWRCQSLPFNDGNEFYRPDFVARVASGITVIDAVTEGTPPWIERAVREDGHTYEAVRRPELPLIRLKNAKDLLRYGNFQAGLEDRVRLLAALDEQGTLTLAECLSVFRETRPIAGLASMVLNRFIDIDLDEALIGPESTVRRRRG